MKEITINRFGILVALISILVLVGLHEWIPLGTLLVGIYAGGAISYEDN